MFFSYDFRYFVFFIDAHTKYIWYFSLVAKFDVFSIFQCFLYSKVFKCLLSVGFPAKLNLFKPIGVVNIVS